MAAPRLRREAAGRRTAAAGDDLVELGELLVAAMVTAFGDELARDVELLPRLFPKRRLSVGIRQDRRRWARLDETGERSERLAPRQRQPRAFERAIALIQSH